MSVENILRTEFEVSNKWEHFLTGNYVEVTKDGQYMYCLSKEVSIVKIETTEILEKISVEEDEVIAMSLSPDNKGLVIALRSSSIRYYSCKDSLTKPDFVRSFKSGHFGPVVSLCWDPSSTYIASASSDGAVRVYHIDLKFCTHSIKQDSGVIKKIQFHHQFEEKPWLIGSCGSDIYIWKLSDGSHSILGVLDSHNSTVTDFQLTENGRNIVSCSLDASIILWDLDSLSCVRVIPVYEAVSCLALKLPDVDLIGVKNTSTDSIYAVIYGAKGLGSIWCVDKAKCLWNQTSLFLTLPEQDGVAVINHMSYVPTLNSLILVTYENCVLFIHPSTMEVWKQMTGYNEDILDLAFCGDNESRLAVATSSGQLRVYERETQNCTLLNAHSSAIFALAVHPLDKNIFGTCSSDNTLKVWKLNDGKPECIAVATGHSHTVLCLEFGPDFVVSGSKDTCLKKWNLKTFKKQNSLVSTYTEIAHSSAINAVSLSKNSKLIVTGSEDKTAKIWSAKNLSHMGTLEGHRRAIWCAEFSPVDQLIATASADGCIKLWNVANYTNIMTLEGHCVAVLRVAWLPSGRQLVSSGADGLLKLWNIKGGTVINTFDAHDSKVWGLCVSQDGHTVITGGEDAMIIWWKDVTDIKALEKQSEMDKIAAGEQKLSNYYKDKKWKKALRLAIELHQPLKALDIIRKILDESPTDLRKVLHKLNLEQRSTLLEFLTSWNVKTKNLRESQEVLAFFVQEMRPQDLQELHGWTEAVEALLPYCERNAKKICAWRQAAAIIPFMVDKLPSVTIDSSVNSALLKGSEKVISNGNQTTTIEEEMSYKIEDLDASEDEE